MYDLLFTARTPLVLASLFLALLASTLAGDRKVWLRGILFNLTPAMGAAFYLVAFIPEIRPDFIELAFALMFEFVVLIIFYKMFRVLLKQIAIVQSNDAVFFLKWLMAAHILVVLPNLGAGFGIFSENSRIDYLYASRLAKYFTYVGFMISIAQAAFLANLLTGRGRLGATGWLVVALNFTLSVLSGSKGTVFLWMIATLSMVDFKNFRFRPFQIISAALLGMSALYASALVVSNFLNLEPSQFADTVLSRFFLVNDARALAIDLRPLLYIDSTLFSESFRSLGGFVGLEPRNDPLGVLLYKDALSVSDNSGANTSLMALIMYYTAPGFAVIPIVISTGGIILVFIMQNKSTKMFTNPNIKLIITSMWTAIIMTYSQDFLAFQLLLILIFPIGLLLWIIQPRIHSRTVSSKHVR